MKIIIDIPDKQYELIKKSDYNAFSMMVSKECMMNAIKIGTPLPKGHGDLKDMRVLKYVFDLTRTDYIYSGEDIRRAIESMTTIVPSDTEESE